MISFPLRAIFIHIPKCAGTSVEDVLWPEEDDRTRENLWGGVFDGLSNPLQTGGLQHLTAAHVRGLYPAEFQAFWKFSIVRNPFDRIASQYFYAVWSRPDILRYLGFGGFRRRFHRIPFRAYVERITQLTHVQWTPMTHFLVDPLTGESLVDFVARFESLEEDWKTIQARLGVDQELGWAKRSPDRPHYREVIDAASRRALEAYYGEDLERFGYGF